MTEVPLLAGFDPGTVQWRAECLQMVNWGGFHGGPHRMDFDADTTLVSGASGTGKSTLLDAYTALMMSSNTPFNGASNDAVRGRARGEGQRTVLSYVRGQRDTGGSEADDGVQALRGVDADAWSILALTFVNDMSQRFTVMKTYFAPTTAQRLTDVQIKMFTRPGAIDVDEVRHFAAVQFDARAMRAQISGLQLHRTQTEFSDVVASRLGIGSHGDGERPLRLLARIQAGHQVATVDRLYKQMVLEDPSTFERADAALAQFADLDRSFRDLETDQRKKDVLEGIEGHHERMVRAQEQADRLDRFGVASTSNHTPFVWWRTQALTRVLDDAEEAALQAKAGAATDLSSAEQAAARAAREYDDLRVALRAEGGERMESLKLRRGQLVQQVAAVRRRRDRFDERTRVLGLSFASATELAELQKTTARGIERAQRDKAESQTRMDQLKVEFAGLEGRSRELADEVASLRTRRGQVPKALDDARNEIARACGMPSEELPFLAELVDLAPEHEQWRLAAEMALRPVALTLLIDVERQAAVRARIDSLQLNRRVRFEGAQLGLALPTDLDPAWLSGRLRFREDSPFVGWVVERLRARGTDHRCVADARDLGGDEPKVTRSGQTSHGRRGAHGTDPGQRAVLGFDNTARIAELQAELDQLLARAAVIKQQLAAAQAVIDEAERRVSAYTELSQATWEDVDVDGPATELADVEAELAVITQRSDAIAELERRVQQAAADHHRASVAQGTASAALEAAQARYDAVVDRKDAALNRVIELERAGVEPPDEADVAYLDEQLAAQPRELTADSFDDCLAQLKQDLTRESSLARREADSERAQLESKFQHYDDLWSDDPDRGTSAVEYPIYKAIYDNIVRHGLYAQRDEFKRRFQQWSGHDLTILHDAYAQAHRDIDDRLEPVNEILRGLSFGPEDDRLQIDVRRVQSAEVVEFGRQLRELASNVMLEWTDEQLDERFAKLRALMRRIAPAEQGGDGTRDELLDVRRHVEVTAIRQGTDGVEKARYSSLGGKSGGESQELAAFIIGAALRYQLGDDTRTRPQFAPVLLDEGFVKADGHFAGRAVQAWRGLGFQLVVSCPEDKVTALEPHMRTLHSVVKDQRRGYSFILPFTGAGEQA